MTTLRHSFGSITAAGILFTDGRLVLAGLQPNKEGQDPFVGGFGGAVELGDTSPFYTAVRETVEELFGVARVPPDLLRCIVNSVRPWKTIEGITPGYICYVCTFVDLEMVLSLARLHLLLTPLYGPYPKSVADLIFQRVVGIADAAKAEVTDLALLPLRRVIAIDPWFRADIAAVAENVGHG